MGVLTKPDLNTERATQQVAIDHVSGKRRDLNLGYYIVRNRGADDVNMTLQEGKAREPNFFAKEPWAVLRRTNRTGFEALKARLRELLTDLVKREFPQLRLDVTKELNDMRKQRKAMGPARASADAQRAYLGAICERFQFAARDALDANYSNNGLFLEREDMRLITRVVRANEAFSDTIWKQGYTRAFAGDARPRIGTGDLELRESTLATGSGYPELDGIIDFPCHLKEYEEFDEAFEDIMSYIKGVYNKSRGADLGTVSLQHHPLSTKSRCID